MSYTTEWITVSQVQPGDSMKSIGSGRIWQNRKHAENSPNAWNRITASEHVKAERARVLTYEDGSKTYHTPSSKMLVRRYRDDMTGDPTTPAPEVYNFKAVENGVTKTTHVELGVTVTGSDGERYSVEAIVQQQRESGSFTHSHMVGQRVGISNGSQRIPGSEDFSFNLKEAWMS